MVQHRTLNTELSANDINDTSKHDSDLDGEVVTILTPTGEVTLVLTETILTPKEVTLVLTKTDHSDPYGGDYDTDKNESNHSDCNGGESDPDRDDYDPSNPSHEACPDL